jgi:hypothetical protein
LVLEYDIRNDTRLELSTEKNAPLKKDTFQAAGEKMAI